MDSIEIKNFKYGLDTRREAITSQPGTLVTLENAHVNQGAEVEQRKAFVPSADLPAGCFGLESTTDGIITFGSSADPGGWPIGNIAAYVRLQHPSVLDGAVYDAAKHAMTAVRFSLPFNGQAFVCATYADGYTFCYYDGALVEQSRRGLVISSLTATTALATQLAACFTGIDGYHTLVSGSSVDIWSDLGFTYAIDAAKLVSTSGILSVLKVSDETAGTPGIAATGYFEVIAFSTLGTITSITVNAVELLGATVVATGLTTNTQVAAAIVTGINAAVSSPRYTAANVDGKVFIYASPTAGSTPNTFVVIVTGQRICIGNGSFALPASADGTTCTSILAGALEILSVTQTRVGSETAWATLIAAQIVTLNTAYTAVSSGAIVYVSKKATSSSDASVTLTITLSAGSVTGNPPGIPVDIRVTDGDGQVVLDWTDTSGATSYKIYRGTSKDALSAYGTSATSDFTDTVAANGVRYYYKMTALNAAGEGAKSVLVSAQPISQTTAVLDNWDIVALNSKITINWSDTPTSYTLKRSLIPGGPYTEIRSNFTAYDDTNVTNGYIYYYIITANDGTTAYTSGELGATPQGAVQAAPFAVALTDISVHGSSSKSSTNVVVTTADYTKAIASGGKSPYTYAWIEVSNPDGIAATLPVHNQTRFFANVEKGKTIFATFVCIVTDASGDTVTSPQVTIALAHT